MSSETTATYICDCGRRFSDPAGIEACQIGNHGEGCQRCKTHARRVTLLCAVIDEQDRRIARAVQVLTTEAEHADSIGDRQGFLIRDSLNDLAALLSRPVPEKEAK